MLVFRWNIPPTDDPLAPIPPATIRSLVPAYGKSTSRLIGAGSCQENSPASTAGIPTATPWAATPRAATPWAATPRAATPRAGAGGAEYLSTCGDPGVDAITAITMATTKIPTVAVSSTGWHPTSRTATFPSGGRASPLRLGCATSAWSARLSSEPGQPSRTVTLPTGRTLRQSPEGTAVAVRGVVPPTRCWRRVGHHFMLWTTALRQAEQAGNRSGFAAGWATCHCKTWLSGENKMVGPACTTRFWPGSKAIIAIPPYRR